MGRTMPTECPHGKVVDWGDFGGHDPKPQPCDVCDARPTLAETVEAAIELHDQALGLLGEARHTLALALARLEAGR